MLELADCFAVGIYDCVVMSNHLHVVVHIDPAAVASWSAEDVTQRWLRLFPVRQLRVSGILCAGHTMTMPRCMYATQVEATGERADF